ncbi:MAG TPA: 1-acyl-sn-glycerol-3-phosphate acyltransferase [Chitinophagaceae bacterium]|nr:1-acyl-sn-glycerol-3-phosphate acyltransferase [Chitinophagaceae bacterium]
MIARLFWTLFLKVLGWNTKPGFPSGVAKCVIIVAPHTSWLDFIIGLAYRSILKLHNAKFLGKKELFKRPFGFLFRWLGGVPVDRFSKHNVVDQVVDIFNRNEKLMIALAPEGTRKKVDKLRTGFYYIAKKAHVPIIMTGFDFKKKTLVFAEPFYVSDDETNDFKRIVNFFAPIQGKHPELGLSHLLTNQ